MFVVSTIGMDPRPREALDDEQARLTTTIYRPFAEGGRWPPWDYLDFATDQQGH